MSDNVGQSYNEQILQSIIDGTTYENENPYPSRIEVLLMELKEAIEAGGGSVVVDQTYSAESTNAQAGTAVAQAISGKADLVDGKVPASQLPYNIWKGTSAQYDALPSDDYELYFVY